MGAADDKAMEIGEHIEKFCGLSDVMNWMVLVVDGKEERIGFAASLNDPKKVGQLLVSYGKLLQTQGVDVVVRNVPEDH
jgi:hypothetical protein